MQRYIKTLGFGKIFITLRKILKNMHTFSKHYLKHIAVAAAVALSMSAMTSCSDSDEDDPDAPSPTGVKLPAHGLFVVNEGNFNYSNASITFYDPSTGGVEQNIFRTANKVPVGDVAQSMTMSADGRSAWIVVNNSNVVFEVDATTMAEKGRITGLVSPRFMHIVEGDDDKAYVTQMGDSRIAVIDTDDYEIEGYIDVPGNGSSTEMMVQVGRYVYVNCWSYDNRILRIDTETDRVAGVLQVDIQPKSMVKDRYNNLWVLTDGGYEGSPYGYEAPCLLKITTSDFKVARRFEMTKGDYTPTLAVNGAGDRIYWIRNDIYSMSVDATELPAEPLIACGGHYYYGLTVDPRGGDIYVADAVDYVQTGRLLRYSQGGRLAGTVDTGICPHAFCWK